MCEKGQEQKTVNTSQSSSTSADPRAQSIYGDVLSRAAGVASTPYQSYSGPLTAGINSQQQLGIGNINANAGYAQPYLQQANSMATGASNPLTQQQIESYLNPYTQNVVDATQAQFNAQNASQQSDLKGNLISQGALGGNRSGVLAAELSGQQSRAQNPVIAGLYQSGYGQALGTAAQQYQQNPMAGANAIAGYGLQGQQAALQGAGQQVSAGNLLQQNEQAGYDAAYKQFLQQQAYPFQTAQWYGNIAGAIAPQYGSTSTGTGNSVSTQPAPSQWAQIAGLGVAAASAFSDERVKEGVEPIGKAFDGQTLYRFRYKGSPQTHVGFLAQEVEGRHPEAVGSYGGVKTVDYDRATDDAAERGEFAAGGSVPGGSGGSVLPYAGGVSWVPEAEMRVAQGPKSNLPSMPEAGFGAPRDNGIGKLTDQLTAYANSPDDPPGGPTSLMSSFGFAPSGVGTSFAGATGGYNPAVSGLYADGGAVNDEEVMDPSLPVENSIVDNTFGMGDRFRTAFKDAAVGPDGAAGPTVPTGQPSIEPEPGFPTPRPRPPGLGPEAPGRLPPQITGPTDTAEAGFSGPAMGYAPEGPRPFARDEPKAGFAPAPPAAAPANPNTMGGFNPLNFSDKARMALIAGGLGVAASRNPSALGAIGEGGLAGVGSYVRAQGEERKAIAEAQKLARDAAKQSEDLAFRTRGQVETERHNRVSETNAADKKERDRVPSGFKRLPDGNLQYEKGGPYDPDQRKLQAAADKGPEVEVDEDAAEILAGRVRAGDSKALTGLGGSAAGKALIQRVHSLVAKHAKYDVPIPDAAKNILSNIANQEGFKAAMRRQATIMANLSVYGRTAFAASEVAMEVNKQTPRTDWMPVNKALNAYRTNTGDPKIVAFGAATNTLINEYARAISGGNSTVHDKQHAEEMLSKAQSPEQYDAVVKMMQREMLAEEKALPAAREHLMHTYNPSSKTHESSIGDKPGAKPAGGQPAGAVGTLTDQSGTKWWVDKDRKPLGKVAP